MYEGPTSEFSYKFGLNSAFFPSNISAGPILLLLRFFLPRYQMESLSLGACAFFFPPSSTRSSPFSHVPCRGSSFVSLQKCNSQILHYQSKKWNIGNNDSKFLDGFLLFHGKPYQKNYSTNAVSNHSEGPGSSMQTLLDVFYRFTRPHTVIGTALSIISVSLLTVEKFSDISPLFLTGLMQALIPSFLMNVYIEGLNQLFDIEIDKINKPDLPLASGEYSVKTGAIIFTTFFFEFCHWSGGWFLAIILGSFHQFCSRNCLFNQSTIHTMEKICGCCCHMHSGCLSSNGSVGFFYAHSVFQEIHLWMVNYVYKAVTICYCIHEFLLSRRCIIQGHT